MRKIILFFLLALCFNTAQAQLGSALKKKAKAAVKKKMNNEAGSEEVSQKDNSAKGVLGGNTAAKNSGSNDFLYTSYPFGLPTHGGRSSYAVDRVKLRRQTTDRGDNVDLFPQQDPDFAWMRFLTTPDLELMSPEGYVGYELVSGSFSAKVGADRSQTMNFQTGAPVLVRGMLISEDIFVVYAASHQGGHAFNVPSYMHQKDITILNIIGPGEKALHEEWLAKAKPIVQEFEAKLQANYEAAAKAKTDAIKIPEAGAMHKDASLLSFAEAGVKKAIEKDGATLLKLHIESNDWSVVKNKHTGKIMYRWIKGAFTEKNKNNDCYLQGFLIKQQYNGSSYGSSEFGGIIHGQMPYGQVMNCENAK